MYVCLSVCLQSYTINNAYFTKLECPRILTDRLQHEGSVTKEILYTVGRNRIEIQKPNLKSKNDPGDPIKIFHKYPYTLKLIIPLNLHRLVQIIYDVIAITSAHSEWLLFLTNLWSGTKVIFLSDIIATCHCMVCTCDIVTLHIFCVHLSLQRMWLVDCSCGYFSCLQINNSNEIQKSTLKSRYPN